MSNPEQPIEDEVVVTAQRNKPAAIELDVGVGDLIGAAIDPTSKAIQVAENIGDQGGKAWFDRTVSPTSRYMMENTGRELDGSVGSQARTALQSLDSEQVDYVRQQISKENFGETVKGRGLYALTSSNMVAGAGLAGGLAARDSSLEQRTAYLAFVESAAENGIAGYASEEFVYQGEKYTILVDATEDPDSIVYGESVSIPFVIIDESGDPISKSLYKEISALPDSQDLIDGTIFNAGYDIMNINAAAENQPGAYDDYINQVVSDPDMVEKLTKGQAHEIVSNTILKEDTPAIWKLDQDGIGYNTPSAPGVGI